MKTKSIEELENDYWNEPSEFPTNLVKRCYEYRKIILSELTVEQIRTLISQKIGVEFLIGIALEKLEQNIIIQGDLYEGDLFESVSKMPIEFWSKYPTESQKFRNIFDENQDKIKAEFGEKEFEQIAERIKASCQHRL